jgi:Holliday junction DNA helicase RuvA
MYEFLRGKVARKLPTAVVLDVGGVGWYVETSLRTSGAARLGAETTLLVHHRVTEDSARLFGFVDEEERDLFRRLLRVSGVGPAHALAMCSSLSPDDVWTALAAADEKRLSTPKGIGPKLAQRLALELKEEARRRGFSPAGRGPTAEGGTGVATPNSGDDAIDALGVLGYSEASAAKAAAAARKKLGAGATVEAVVKEALRAAT